MTLTLASRISIAASATAALLFSWHETLNLAGALA